ncbi:hypothetical protein [Geothrix fuzhouensis]|uniref:hypothetical protein n=1 Tax=Geothrix fuzhouensis TaxID=2966451 RepID=UPI0021485378|nr:hypothetical protein [Geothrix fuzhouensis]
MNRTAWRQILVLCVCFHSMALRAEAPAAESFRVGILGSAPLGGFKDLASSSAGFGVAAGWRFWDMSPDCRVGLFLEHRVYSTATDRAALTDLGVDLRTRIRGGFYNRLGLGGERVDFPGDRTTTKLGGVFGFGYRTSGPLGFELYTTHLAASHPSATTLSAAVMWHF